MSVILNVVITVKARLQRYFNSMVIIVWNVGRIIRILTYHNMAKIAEKNMSILLTSKLVDDVAPKQFAGMNPCHQFLANVLSGFPANHTTE
jgi:hypothetical protein